MKEEQLGGIGRLGKAQSGKKRRAGNGADTERGVTLEDFWAYMIQHLYIFAPTGDLWPGSSVVNARIPPIQVGVDDDGKPVFISASAWLDLPAPTSFARPACCADATAIHLAAYLMWRLNWIHPFADGNGRTARMTSYVGAADHHRPPDLARRPSCRSRLGASWPARLPYQSKSSRTVCLTSML
jgi:hypothetical protein